MAQTKEERKATRAARIERYKAEHRCIACAKQDARTLSGMAYCEACQAKHYAAYRYVPTSELTPEKQEERRAKHRETERRFRERREAAGVCIVCGIRPRAGGTSYCEQCLGGHRALARDKMRRMREEKRMRKMCSDMDDPQKCLNCKLEHCVFDREAE